MKNIEYQKLIKELFKNNPTLSLKSRQVAMRLDVQFNDEYQAVRKILHEMVDKNILNYNKKEGYRFINSNHRKQGIFRVERNGEGIVELQNGTIVKIEQNYFSTAFSGDTVEIALLASKKNKQDEILQFGEIIKVISRAHSEFVGTLEKSKNYFFVIPDDPKMKRDLYISSQNLGGAKSGQKVIAKLISWDTPNLNPEGKIVEILGFSGEVAVEIKSVVAKFRLEVNFPNEVVSEVKNISDEIKNEEILKRKDLRSWDIYTIDPEDAKDFDDALSIEKISDKNYLLGIHIADVAHYVTEESKTDIEALKRGTSVYMANHVIPMLPEKLSNDLCSLKPKVDRLAFSCLVNISNQGVVNSFEFVKTIIHSKKRFSYEEADKVLEKKSGVHYNSLASIWSIAQKLKSLRLKNGSIDFDSPEVKFIYDQKGMPVSVKQKSRLRSHQLVEECMLLANKLVSKYLSDKRNEKNIIPLLYRVHDKPDEKKIYELVQFAKRFGYSLNLLQNMDSKSIQNLLNQIKDKPEEYLINEVTLRAMAKAIYSEKNIGHFGLGFKYYSHFTSPIRRYPDLILHRLLHEYNSGMKITRQNHFAKILPGIAKQSSNREKIAVEAERDSIKVMKSEYMKRHIGDEFCGIISGVTHFGIFVEIFDILIEGFVPMRELRDDYYIYDEKNYSLVGRKTQNILRLGDEVKVLVSKVNVEKKQVDFELIENISKKKHK